MPLNDSFKSINKKSILYELVVYNEWFHEHDINLKKFGQPSPSLWSFISYVNPSRLLYSTPNVYEHKSGYDLAWKLACSSDGMVVAILQDNFFEIRTSKDGYVAVVGKASVGYDEIPSLRRICWSPDSSVLAVAKSSGVVSLFSLLGSHLLTIPAESITTSRNPVVTLTFLDTKFKHTKWSSELLIVQYDGTVRSYLLSALDSHAIEENIKFHLCNIYGGGVTCALFHPDHHMLVVAGHQSKGKEELGITAWRVLNDPPYLKPAFGEENRTNSSSWFWFKPFLSKEQPPHVTTMKLSPDGKTIGCLQSNGAVLLLATPSLRLIKSWPLIEQPEYIQAETKKEGLWPVHLDWWSVDALVLVRRNGSVTVCCKDRLENLLGEAGEMLCGPPHVAAVRGGRQGVLILDCEKHRSLSEEEETEHDETLDDDASILQASIQGALYSMTDIETFQPIKKPPRVVQKTYKLLGIKSITPEELYLRKIENCAYEDALLLAQTYGLDCDLVYQRQWRTNPVSAHTINSYLGKVSRIDWVANECIQRVPDTLLAANQLLTFGLDVTNCKGGAMTDAKRKMIAVRLKILYYLDGLRLYEKMLKNSDDYDSTEYDSLRCISSVEAAVRFAHAKHRNALSVMFTYRTQQVLPHYLPILSNLPETLRPSQYRVLLPQLTADGKNVVPWETDVLRDKDWAEDPKYAELSTNPVDDSSILYAEDPSLKKFNMAVLTADVVIEWYKSRAYSIERTAGLVEHAATLLRIAREKNVPGLDNLYFDLLTLEALVQLGDDQATIESIQDLPYLEQGILLMQKTQQSSFINDLKHEFLVFVARCQQRGCADKEGLLKGLMLFYSQTGLQYPLMFVEHLKEHTKCPLGLPLTDLMELALDCIYSYREADQLQECFAILECLPEKTHSDFISADEAKLHERVDQLEKHLVVCQILDKSECGRSPQYVRDVTDDVEQIKILMREVAASDKEPCAESIELLDDLLELQGISPHIDKQFCYELFASNRLNSEDSSCIEASVEYLSCWSKETWKPVPYQDSVKLILDAYNTYLERSTAFDDPLVKLAEQCLKLVTESNDEVQAGLDLIEALYLMGHFNVRVLPLQVRMMSNRWSLIEKCLGSAKDVYKSTELLIQLAQSLQLEGSDRSKREGQVLMMVAKTALDAEDYKFCSDVCSRLMTRNYVPAWHVVNSLGRTAAVTPHKQQELMAFATLHCPRDVLEDVVETRIKLRSDEAKYQLMCIES